MMILILCGCCAAAGCLAGMMTKDPPDPPYIDKEEILDYFRAIAAREERGEAEKIFSVRDIARGLYEIEREARCG